MADHLSDALVEYLSFGVAASPQRRPGRLVELFGSQEGAELEAKVLALLGEMSLITIDWSQHSLESGGRLARATLQSRHPELSGLAIDALAWKFTYDWR